MASLLDKLHRATGGSGTVEGQKQRTQESAYSGTRSDSELDALRRSLQEQGALPGTSTTETSQTQADTGDVQGFTSGGGSAQHPVLNQAAIRGTRDAINELDTSRRVGMQSIRDGHGELIGRYDHERNQNQADFDRQGTTNTQNLLQNRQNALSAGAQGLRGLRGTLASLGALGGDGGVLANRAATTAVNQDLGGADDAYAQNAQELDSAWGRFESEDERRRAEAETARRNQERALGGDLAGQRQSLYQRLAELFAEGGDTGQAESYLDRASGLNRAIAESQGVSATPFTPGQAAFTPDSLQSYLAGAGDMRVGVGEGQGGEQSLLAGNRDARGRRRDEEREF